MVSGGRPNLTLRRDITDSMPFRIHSTLMHNVLPVQRYRQRNPANLFFRTCTYYIEYLTE